MIIDKNLIMIRHGENVIDDNVSNNDLVLSEKGLSQAWRASLVLKNQYDVIVSSPSKRCVMTAYIINEGKMPVLDQRLLERGWGNGKQDGTESDEEAKVRFEKFLSEIMIKYDNKKVLLVTHGSLMRLAQDVVEGSVKARGSIRNCTIVDYTKKRKRIYRKY